MSKLTQSTKNIVKSVVTLTSIFRNYSKLQEELPMKSKEHDQPKSETVEI